MAATAAIVSFVGSTVGGLVQANQQKQKQKGDQAALQRNLDASIAATPPPPSTAAANAQAGQAMTLAAQRQRRIAQGAGGFSGTILTSPTGTGPAVTQRKTLIGQ
jgi:Tfp pilus assembly protein PilN